MNCNPRLCVLHKLTYIQLNVFTFIYTIYLLFMREKRLYHNCYFKKKNVCLLPSQCSSEHCYIALYNMKICSWQ